MERFEGIFQAAGLRESFLKDTSLEKALKGGRIGYEEMKGIPEKDEGKTLLKDRMGQSVGP